MTNDLESLKARVFDGKGWNKAFVEGALIHDLWAEIERLQKLLSANDTPVSFKCSVCGAWHLKPEDRR